MNPKVIGLTGGIGSGKSTVATYFASLGVPVYIADDAAREIMQKESVVDQIGRVFIGTVVNGLINRAKLAEIVFNDPVKLQQLNKIIHPAVKLHFQEWLLRQDSAFVIREAAILFESGSYLDCDSIITVTAPLDIRIERVMKRDNSTRDDVMKRIANQWSDEMRISKSDYVIVNVELSSALQQAHEIYLSLLNH